MTKAAALHQFFNSFGIPAYTSTSVPDDAEFPWMTYEPVISGRGETVASTVNLWYRTTSEAVPNAKVEEMAEAIDNMNPIKCDNGLIWIMRDSTWCTPLNSEVDPVIKIRRLNILICYLTSH